MLTTLLHFADRTRFEEARQQLNAAGVAFSCMPQDQLMEVFLDPDELSEMAIAGGGKVVSKRSADDILRSLSASARLVVEAYLKRQEAPEKLPPEEGLPWDSPGYDPPHHVNSSS